MLPVFYAWKQFFLSRPIASQFVGYHDARDKASRFEEFAEKLFGRSFVPMALHQDIEDLPFGILEVSELMTYECAAPLTWCETSE